MFIRGGENNALINKIICADFIIFGIQTKYVKLLKSFNVHYGKRNIRLKT